jgi:hypothetical protein
VYEPDRHAPSTMTIDEARTLLESIVKRHDEDALRTCVEARWDNDACEAVRALLSRNDCAIVLYLSANRDSSRLSHP